MQSWNKLKVIDTCLVTDYVANGSFKSLRENVQYSKEKNYSILLRTTDFTNNFRKEFVYVDEDSFKFLKKSSLVPNDIIICNVGSVGLTFLVPDLNTPMTLGPNAILVRPLNSNLIDNFYLFYLFTSPIGQNLIKSITSGTTQNKFNKTNFRQLEIPVPPFREQKEIVEILDQAFESIDKAKANIEKNIENAEELFQSKLNQVFSQTEEGWSIKQLNEICENLDRKRIPITKNKRKPGEVPYYGASGIVDYVEGYLFNEDLLLVSEDGANLLARTYPIAFSISGKTWVNNHAHVLRFEDISTQFFIEYYLNSIKLDDYVSGMAQPKLNQKKLSSIPVPYPELSIQKELVETLDVMDNHIQSLLSSYEEELKNLEELKKSILQKAFSGELTNKNKAA